MNRKGNPLRQRPGRKLRRHLKTECVGDLIAPSKAAAKLMIFDYIETFYNRRRRHSSPGYLSPLDFEKQIFPQNRNN